MTDEQANIEQVYCKHCGELIEKPRMRSGKVDQFFCSGKPCRTRYHNSRRVKLEEIQAEINKIFERYKEKCH